jgi:hypothetical protein
MMAALLCLGSPAQTQEMPQMAAPVKEHEWLKKFIGEWDMDVEIFMQPGEPPMKTKSTDVTRALGGFWIVSEGKGEAMGHPFGSVMIVGFDPAKKKYVGTWVDNMNSHLWRYEGSVDPSGNTLTLESEGPCPMKPGQMVKFRDVTEFKSNDHRVFTSSMLGDDGKWVTLVRGDSRRKK